MGVTCFLVTGHWSLVGVWVSAVGDSRQERITHQHVEQVREVPVPMVQETLVSLFHFGKIQIRSCSFMSFRLLFFLCFVRFTGLHHFLGLYSPSVFIQEDGALIFRPSAVAVLLRHTFLNVFAPPEPVPYTVPQTCAVRPECELRVVQVKRCSSSRSKWCTCPRWCSRNASTTSTLRTRTRVHTARTSLSLSLSLEPWWVQKDLTQKCPQGLPPGLGCQKTKEPKEPQTERTGPFQSRIYSPKTNKDSRVSFAWPFSTPRVFRVVLAGPLRLHVARWRLFLVPVRWAGKSPSCRCSALDTQGGHNAAELS